MNQNAQKVGGDFLQSAQRAESSYFNKNKFIDDIKSGGGRILAFNLKLG